MADEIIEQETEQSLGAGNEHVPGSEIVTPSEKVTNQTLLIEVATRAYPVALYTIFQKFNDRSFALNPPRVDIENLGYVVVVPTAMPEGDVVTEGSPAEADGVWRQTWVTRAFNAKELAEQLAYAKETANDKVLAVRNDDFQIGMTHVVGDKTFNVQLRIEDRINLLAMYTISKELVTAGIEDPEPFRSYENETIMLTPQQTVEMALAAFAAVKSISQLTWTLKDQIDAAVVVADIPTIPSTFIPA